MPLISDRYAETKPWFSVDDLPNGKELRLVVAKLELDVKVGRDKKRDLLWFAGEERYLFVDNFTGPILCKILGDNSDDWPGRPIILFTEMADVRGESRPVMRIRAGADTPPPRPFTPEEKRERLSREIDDDLDKYLPPAGKSSEPRY